MSTLAKFLFRHSCFASILSFASAIKHIRLCVFHQLMARAGVVYSPTVAFIQQQHQKIIEVSLLRRLTLCKQWKQSHPLL